MSVVTLTINDKLVSAPANATLLDAIQEQGIDVPTLCHLKGLSERGGCRLCVVEMAGSPRLFAACVTPVAEGMVVLTHTERLIKYRQMMIELLLAERNHVCAVCVQNGTLRTADPGRKARGHQRSLRLHLPGFANGRQPRTLRPGP